MEWMFLFFLSLFLMEVECGGKIWLKLISFSNGRGKGANGHYCDGKFFIRGSDCDHRFIICMDTTYGPQNSNDCAFGRIRTATTFNTNHITFGSRLGGQVNPMTFSFNRWSGSCKIKIDVYDDDDNRDDYVDFIYGYYYISRPYYNERTAVISNLKLQYRTTMNVQLSVYCDPDYYGSGCDIYCGSSNKYTCNKQTGAKICSNDWTGPDCDVKKDACISTPCQNRATCHNSMGSYLCVCEEGYTGTQCEQEVDECASIPCKNNGTCIDLLNNYKCSCPYGYSSQDCSVIIDICINKPCLNNGICTMDTNEVVFHCDCSKGWTGKICGTDVDECITGICQNGATCENNLGSFRCHCLDGWTGDECNSDIDECLSVSCYGNATCQNTNGSFICICESGYTGRLCDVNIDECSSSPCLNGGVCHDEVNGVMCECSNGYKGHLCEEEIDECKGTNEEIVIYLDGKITVDDRDRLISSIKKIVSKYGGFDIGSIDFTGSSYWLQDYNGATISNVTFSLSINGTKLCGEDIDVLKGLLKKEEYKLSFKIYNGDIASLHQDGAMVGKQKVSQKRWIENNWYLVMIAVVLLALTGVAFFALVHYKRKKNMSSNGEIHNNNSFWWNSGTGTSSTLPSLAFDNDLYQSVPQQTIVGTTDNIQTGVQDSPLTIENNIYQQPEEQTKLMTLDVDRFYNDLQ